MSRAGKARAAPDAQTDAQTIPQFEARVARCPAADGVARRRGAARMSLPDAAEQRINASEAAATQRKANAMSPEERQTKRNADQQRRREQKAKKMEEREALHQQLCRALDSLTVKEYQTFFTWREGEEPDMDTGEVDPAVELQLLAKWTRTRAADFEVAIQQLARDERLGVRECEDFQSWLLETGLLPDHESLCDWRCSPEYQA